MRTSRLVLNLVASTVGVWSLAGHALAASPAVAANALAGYGEVYAGWSELKAQSSGYTSGHLGTVGGGGFVNIPLGPAWSLEAEGRGYHVDWSGPFTASDTGYFAHLFRRDPGRLAFGAFGGHTALTLYGMHGSMFTGGVEAQAYLNSLTLYGQAGWYRSTAKDGGWLYFTGTFLRGTARYFPTPNLQLQLDAQYATLDNSDHTIAWTLQGSAEARLGASPFSAFVRARWDSLTPVVNQPYSTTTVLLGVRAYFGSGTLQGNDRSGASFDVLPFPTLYALNFG